MHGRGRQRYSCRIALGHDDRFLQTLRVAGRDRELSGELVGSDGPAGSSYEVDDAGGPSRIRPHIGDQNRRLDLGRRRCFDVCHLRPEGAGTLGGIPRLIATTKNDQSAESQERQKNDDEAPVNDPVEVFDPAHIRLIFPHGNVKGLLGPSRHALLSGTLLG